MSSENIRILRELVAAYNSGDIDRILEFTDRDFDGQVPPELSAEPDSYLGHEGVRRYFRTWDAMEDVRFLPDSFWDAGEGVVVTMRLTARGRQTGIAVEQRFAQLWHLRGRRAIRVRTYTALSDALEAAGLPVDQEPDLALPADQSQAQSET